MTDARTLVALLGGVLLGALSVAVPISRFVWVEYQRSLRKDGGR